MNVAGHESVDVLVIGGGPAGSTCAAVLAKYHPSLKVMLVEKEDFPRYHIGESLILENNRILNDMGALEKVASAGFVEKAGATFVWGRDREPWSLLFDDGKLGRPDPKRIFKHTWHVERSRFDRVLLETAREHGADVRRSRCVDVITSDTGRVVGAQLKDPAGTESRVEARFVVDAGGRGSILAHRVGRRVFDPLIKNVGVYAYWRGAQFHPRYSMARSRPCIVVVAMPIGWIWYIPIAPDVMSVGIVTSHKTLQGELAATTMEEFYRKHLRTCDEVRQWLEGAEMIQLPGTPSPVMVENDFNYCNDRLVGPGCALAGDAGGFIDPLFSIGVFLAQTAGQLIGYTVGTALAGDSGMDEERLLAAYEQHVWASINAYRSMVYVFYGFNESKEEWWQKTREVVRSQALPADIDDRDAFKALTFGFGVNVMLFNEAMHWMALTQIRDALLLGAAHAIPEPEPETRPRAGSQRPRIRRPYTLVPSAVPAEGTGRVVPMYRMEFASGAGISEHLNFPRHLYIPDNVVPLIERLDGTHTLDQLFASITTSQAAPGSPGEARHAFDRLIDVLVGFEAIGFDG